MIDSYKNKSALLIGNGINLLGNNQSFSWAELLEKLKREFGIQTDLENDFKPFPLAFEEMLHQKPGRNSYKNKVRNVKKEIRNQMEKLTNKKEGFNEFHRKIAALAYNDILTTNYDYSIEKSLYQGFEDDKWKLALNRQESKYSLKRGYGIKDKKVWHIHGELSDVRNISSPKFYNEESIMIGFEHYAAYQQKIQENIKGKSGKQNIENQSLFIRLKNQSKNNKLDVSSPFWTDLFFTHNIDIIGLGLDFSEHHLWWLINYRSNAMRTQSPKYEININNNINFYFPKINKENIINIAETNDIDKMIKIKNKLNKSKAIAELLNSFNVNIKEIEANSYQDFYNKFIERKRH